MELKKILKRIEEKFSVNLIVVKIEVLKNWGDLKCKYVFDVDSIDLYLKKEEKVNIQILTKNKIKAGCQIEYEKGVYLTNLWVDTQRIEGLDEEYITEINDIFYNKILKIVLELEKVYDIKLSSIGVETLFEYNKKIENIIKESEYVNMWVIMNQDINNVKGFVLDNEKSKSKIFRKYNIH